MTRTKVSSNKAPSSSAAPSFAMSLVSPAGTAQWIEIMAGSGRFISQRLEEDLKTQQAFLGCKAPAEVMQVQTEYFKTAVEQYSAEAGRVLKIMTDPMSSALLSPRSMFARGYDDVPL